MEELNNEMTQMNSVSEQENVGNTNDYIEAIKEMKQNSVNKEAYDRLREENKKLINTLAHSSQLESNEVKKEEPVDLKQLRNDLFNKEQSNLDFISNALKLRDELIKRGDKDPFLPQGANIIPTDEDISTAKRVAETLKDCVDYADGDSNIFTSELQRVMVDSAPIRNKRR